MDFTIKPNSQGEISEVVVLDNTAIKMGSGKSPVYATPALVALMENAAILPAKASFPKATTPLASPSASSTWPQRLSA